MGQAGKTRVMMDFDDDQTKVIDEILKNYKDRRVSDSNDQERFDGK